MTTHFITAEIELQDSTADLQREIATTLAHHGEPLRWAVTDVNAEQQTVVVEAVVTAEELVTVES